MDKHTDCCGLQIRRTKIGSTPWGICIPHQYDESLVKKYIGLCRFSHFFRIFAVLLVLLQIT